MPKTKKNVEQVLVEKVYIEEDLYPRQKLNAALVGRYAEAMRAGADFPPGKVTPRNGKFLLIDGRHRLEASKVVGRAVFSAEVVELGDREAFVQSVEMNTRHGRALARDDLRNCVARLREYGVPPEMMRRVTGLEFRTLTDWARPQAKAREVTPEEIKELEEKAQTHPIVRTGDGTEGVHHVESLPEQKRASKIASLKAMVEALSSWPDEVVTAKMEGHLLRLRKIVNGMLVVVRRRKKGA